MPQAQFFNTPAPTPFSARDFVDTQNAAYGHDQTVTANNLFAKHMDANGNLNENGYYTDAARAGLSREAMGQPIDWYQKQKAAALQTATTNESLKQLGYNPMAGGRNSTQVGEPAQIATTVPTQRKTAEERWAEFRSSFKRPDGLPTVSQIAPQRDMVTTATPVDIGNAPMNIGNQAIDTTQVQAQPAITEPQVSTQPSDNLALGDIQLQGSVPTPMLPPDQEQVYTNAPDTRTALQRIEDSYVAPEASTGVELGSEAPAVSADIFKFEPTNDGTNQYRQYAEALASNLKANGFGSPSDYLQQVYAQTLKTNMPTKPSPLLILQKDGQAKFAEANAAYKAGLIQAHGKAEASVTAAKDKLTEAAKEYGVNTVEQRKSDLSTDETLRDPTKRNEAAAIKTNKTNISNLETELGEAGTSNTKLGFLLPKAIRAYATSQNPGQQLSEGNLVEVGQSLLPEHVDRSGKVDAIGMSILRGLTGMTTSSEELSRTADWIAATDPKTLRQRVNTLLSETKKLNEVQYNNYIIRNETPAQKAERLKSEADVEAARLKAEAQVANTPVVTKKQETAGDQLKRKHESIKKPKAVVTPKEGATKKNNIGMDVIYRNGKWQAK